MNILFDINHPGHIHFFKNAIKILREQSHNITITARDKDVTLELLDHYNMPYKSLSKASTGYLGLGLEMICRESKLLPLMIKNKIQVCASVTGACTSHLSKILRIPSLVFYDTEHAKLQNAITYPFATKIFTPYTYWDNLGDNHVRYKGVKELAYLHPNYFKADPSILETLGISSDEKFFILRFVAMRATHDLGLPSVTTELKRKLIQHLSKFGKVYIVSESELEEEFTPYKLKIPVTKLHDVLSYASLYIGEGGVTAQEAALLGTPALLVTPKRASVSQMMEKEYDLMYTYSPEDETEIFDRTNTILEMPNAKEEWSKKVQTFLNDTTDVTQFIINSILHYDKNSQKDLP